MHLNTTNTTTPSTTRVARPRYLPGWASALAIGIAALPAAFGQPSYFVTELPVPAGYEASSPYQINDQGFVVGCSSRASDQVATVWKGGSALALGKLKDGTYSLANAINSSGVIAGEGDDGDGRPLGWVTSAGKLVNFFSNNGGNTHPIAINDAGIIGGYYIKGFSSTWRSAIWTIDPKDARKSTKLDLPLLPDSDLLKDSAIAFAFNKKLEAAGWVTSPSIGQHAAFWKGDAAHTIVDLGVYGSDWSSIANSLNDLGQVVGSSYPPSNSHPILWQNDAAHTAVALPFLPGDTYGDAWVINNSATIVGWSGVGEPGTWNVTGSRLVVWSAGQPYELQTLLVQPAAPWTLIHVSSINNLGQMTGIASQNGVMKAVVLSPGQ